MHSPRVLKVLKVVDVKNNEISHNSTVGLSEDVASVGWARHSPNHPGLHQAAGPYYVPARSLECVTATLNVVTLRHTEAFHAQGQDTCGHAL